MGRSLGAAAPGPRVLHLSPVPFGADGYFGGGERYPLELARAMARLTPTTYASFSQVGRESLHADLTEVLMPRRFRLDSHDLNPVSERLVRVIARHDVIHVHQWESLAGNLAVVLSAAMRRRVFLTDHGGWTRNLHRRAGLHRWVNASLDVSDFAGSFYPEFGARHATVLGGVDTDRFSPGEPSGRGDHLLFVGRLMPHKGLHVLLEALPRHVPLRVVGRPYAPDYVERLRDLAAGKDVTFIHDADDEAVVDEYRRARALVLPSVYGSQYGRAAPKSELLGLTLVEAMACGTPVICSRTGGMPEVVREDTGFVVEPGDVSALRRAIDGATDAGRWVRLSKAARRDAVDRWTWRATADRCLDAYDRFRHR